MRVTLDADLANPVRFPHDGEVESRERHHVLVVATGITIDPAELRHVRRAWRSVAASALAGVTILPALAWAVANLAPAGPRRDGVLAAGVAP
ncbi:MAG: hypothetical protein ACYDEN_02850 [Acidimicrobiales bacterium]